jgi:hypothetical protein
MNISSLRCLRSQNRGTLKIKRCISSFSHSEPTHYSLFINIAPSLLLTRNIRVFIMAKTSHVQSKPSKVKKSLRQKRDRRKNNLEKKSQEYSEMCGADVCLGIRIRESGKVFIFSADASGFWSFLDSQLVCAVESLRGFKYQA